MNKLKIVFWCLAVIATVLVVWIAIPPKILFNPSLVTINGAQVKSYRTFPMKQWLKIPIIKYSEHIRPVDGSTPCSDTAEFRYKDNGLPYAIWSIDHWAARCITQDYHYQVFWSPRLFGIIPLRPIEIDLYVEVD